MNLRRIFRRTRPTPPPPELPSRTDMNVAFLHGLSLAEWDALPALVKADLRERVAWEVRG